MRMIDKIDKKFYSKWQLKWTKVVLLMLYLMNKGTRQRMKEKYITKENKCQQK